MNTTDASPKQQTITPMQTLILSGEPFLNARNNGIVRATDRETAQNAEREPRGHRTHVDRERREEKRLSEANGPDHDDDLRTELVLQLSSAQRRTRTT